MQLRFCSEVHLSPASCILRPSSAQHNHLPSIIHYLIIFSPDSVLMNMGHHGQNSDVTGEITARVQEISLGAPEGPPSHDAANGSASQGQ